MCYPPSHIVSVQQSVSLQIRTTTVPGPTCLCDDHQQKSGSNVYSNRMLLPDSCFAHGQLYVAFSRCGYPPNDTNNTGMKVVVYDNQIQGRKKDDGGIRTNETEGTTTQNIVLKEIFR